MKFRQTASWVICLYVLTPALGFLLPNIIVPKYKGGIGSRDRSGVSFYPREFEDTRLHSKKQDIVDGIAGLGDPSIKLKGQSACERPCSPSVKRSKDSVTICDIKMDLENEDPKSFRDRDPTDVTDDDDDAGFSIGSIFSASNAPEEASQTSFAEAMIDNVFIRIDMSDLKERILESRGYARPGPFKKDRIRDPIILDDMLQDPTKPIDSLYLSFPATFITFVGATLIFPVILDFFNSILDMDPAKLDDIATKFVPGVSILYGTYISLTLSILYNRQREVQNSVSKETALLGFILQNFMGLFRNNRMKMIEAAQSTADQCRILIEESRGLEYMGIVYTDPYVRMLQLVTDEEERLIKTHGDFQAKGPMLGTCRDTIKELRTIRATRLSDEALSLPPTHFFILQALTFLILLGYVISVLPAVDALGFSPFESSVLFGILSSIYLLFYNVSTDLNDLYTGVFQIRRGGSASHLSEIKHIIASHRWLNNGDVTFECLDEVDVAKLRKTRRNPDMSEQKFCVPDTPPKLKQNEKVDTK